MESITNGYAWYVKGSPYSSGEDDLWTGGECSAREQAEKKAARAAKKEGRVWIIIASFGRCDYTNPRTLRSGVIVYDTVLDEENVLSETQVGVDTADTADNDDWKREQAMQAGMAFGCAGFNDIMGY